MNMWIQISIIAAIVAGVFMIKKAGQISSKDAVASIKNGATIIDVRSADEFNSGHLPDALNLSLDNIETTVPEQIKDKNQVLLLHCLSGMRSGMAQRRLKSLGYTNVFNLGSLARARDIYSQAKR